MESFAFHGKAELIPVGDPQPAIAEEAFEADVPQGPDRDSSAEVAEEAACDAVLAGDGQKIPAESIQIGGNNIAFKADDMPLIVNYGVRPKETTDKITWTSSNPDVIEVIAPGVIKPKKNGKAIITATAESGVSASCEFSVSDCQADLILDAEETELLNEAGNKFCLKVMIHDTEGHAGGRINVRWPKKYFTFLDAESGGHFNASMGEIRDTTNEEGVVIMLFDGSLEKKNIKATENALVATLAFEIKEGAPSGEHLFEFLRSDLFNAEADILGGESSNHYPGSYEGVNLSLIDPAATYRVTFDANGHGTAPDPIENVTYKSKVSAPEDLAEAGYTFGGWYKDVNGVNKWDFANDVVRWDTTLYAKWTANTNTAYKVEHYQQNQTGNGYVLKDTDNRTGTTAELTEAEAESYTGFTVKEFSQESIAGDGSTVIKIYYNRNTYTVTWKNSDTVLESDTNVRYGTKPSYDSAVPTKGADAQYTYTFSGWSPAITEETVVTENVTYTAQFSTTTNTYTITWKNGDEVLETDTGVPYGTKPSFDSETPRKTGDAQYSYMFAGWSPAITDATIVEGNATYTAQFTSTVNTYTVIWKNGDAVLETDTNVPYGTKPEYNGTTPEKAADAQYTYTFSSWDPAVTDAAAVTGDVTYSAQFTSSLNTYTVTWKNEDAIIETDTNVPYGTKPEYNGTTPEKAADAQYTYTFSGWDPAITDAITVTGNVTYTAQFTGTKRKYDVVFDANGHGTAPAKIEGVEYGSSIAEPTALSETGYTFGGWFKESGCQNEWVFASDTVGGATTLYAKWTVNSHKVKYVYTDTTPAGAPAIADAAKDYGITVQVAEKPALAGYTLSDWTTMDVTVSGGSFVMPDTDVTFTARWTANTNTPYTVEHYQQDVAGDGYTKKAAENLTGTTAQQTAAAAKEYEGFTVKEFSQKEISGDGTTVIKIYYDRKTFTVTWKNGDAVLETDTGVRYGAKPSYDSAVPTKEAGIQYCYTFSGWGPAVSPDTTVTENVTYTAQFTEALRKYDVTFDANGHGTAPAKVEGVEYGSTIAAPTVPTTNGYTFAEWYKEAACENAWNFETDTIGGAVTLYAKWTANTNTPYKVEHYQQDVVGNGYSKKETDDLTGTTAETTKAAAKAYAGFTVKPFTQGTIGANGDTVIKIYYDRNTFSVTWKNGDQTLKTEELRYQSVPSYRGDTPVKQADAQYTYAFNGWDPVPTALTAPVTYQAKFTQSLRKHTVVFKDWNGSNISTQQVSYGSAAAAPSDPKRSGYSFTGWDKDFTKITGDLTVTAQYETSRSSSGGGGGGSSGGGGGGGSSGGGGGGGSSGGGGGGGSSGGGGGGGPTAKKTAAAGTATFSKNWFADAAGVWRIKDKAGNIVTSAWLCDDAVAANGQSVWYLMNTDGTMLAAGLVQDNTGNYYSLEMNHNGYYGMLRYVNGTYDGIYMEFSQKHDGTFGAITNQSAIDALKAKYGVTKFGVGNENCIYTKNF
ncbi:MAG: InlB B-repeat-containing protein [Lachnospiraceae bacterium]|nr:InlB B-repeat-containing protein [Lachnospiraceae bacterium]